MKFHWHIRGQDHPKISDGPKALKSSAVLAAEGFGFAVSEGHNQNDHFISCNLSQPATIRHLSDCFFPRIFCEKYIVFHSFRILPPNYARIALEWLLGITDRGLFFHSVHSLDQCRQALQCPPPVALQRIRKVAKSMWQKASETISQTPMYYDRS